MAEFKIGDRVRALPVKTNPQYADARGIGTVTNIRGGTRPVQVQWDNCATGRISYSPKSLTLVYHDPDCSMNYEGDECSCRKGNNAKT